MVTQEQMKVFLERPEWIELLKLIKEKQQIIAETCMTGQDLSHDDNMKLKAMWNALEFIGQSPQSLYDYLRSENLTYNYN